MSNYWLTKQECSRIRYHAKKMGGTNINLSCIWHHIDFGQAGVSFVFKPLKYKLKLSGSYSIDKGDFETVEDVERIKNDMLNALKFVEYLKEIENTIGKGGNKNEQ